MARDGDPGQRRVFVGVRLTPGGLVRIDELAAQHTKGERSEMIRRLLRLGIKAWDRGER